MSRPVPPSGHPSDLSGSPYTRARANDLRGSRERLQPPTPTGEKGET